MAKQHPLLLLFLLLAISAWAIDESEYSMFPEEDESFVPEMGEDELQDSFDTFVKDYNKEYESDEHKSSRYKIFKNNMARIDFLNKHDSNAQYGVTEHADLSDEEVAQKLHGYYPEDDEIEDFSFYETNEDPDFNFLDDEDYELPKNWDWRDHGAVTHVKNQMHCGACWAFSVLGNIEGLMKIKGQKLRSLSEQNLLDCDRDQNGCHGGLPSRAFHWLAKKGGVDLEIKYRYVGRRKKCQYLKKGPALRTPVKSWVHVPKDEEKIAAYLHKHGPLAMAMHGRGWLHFYRGGIATPPHCPMKITHGLVLVGYGEENGVKYWTIKNSWGPKFGEKGFFRMIRGENKCNIIKLIQSAVLKDVDTDEEDAFLNDEEMR